ncbi:MAG: winged helix-turn-helix transcriptional regulator [Euryarchaeota archaeon]|nr:winged helix-turn-helix transcriptional regulator [Euryarchaeota archaeon]
MLRSVRGSIVFIAVFAICASLASGAMVHGTTYEWSTFEVLENTIVEVDSTPPQCKVASFGSYSFDLPEGTYTIRAEYYQGNVLEYYAEENITIIESGDFVLDLLMFPPIEDAFLCEGINFSEDLCDYEEPDEIIGEEDSMVFPVAIAIFLVLIIGYAAFLWRGRKVRENDATGAQVPGGAARYEPPEPDMDGALERGVEMGRERGQKIESAIKPEPAPEYGGTKSGGPAKSEVSEESGESDLPPDLKEVLLVIRDGGGRITQKELRARLKYSEAKVSLMITDLEDRGVVKKVKKGRGNIIILKGM